MAVTYKETLEVPSCFGEALSYTNDANHVELKYIDSHLHPPVIVIVQCGDTDSYHHNTRIAMNKLREELKLS